MTTEHWTLARQALETVSKFRKIQFVSARFCFSYCCCCCIFGFQHFQSVSQSPSHAHRHLVYGSSRSNLAGRMSKSGLLCSLTLQTTTTTKTVAKKKVKLTSKQAGMQAGRQREACTEQPTNKRKINFSTLIWERSTHNVCGGGEGRRKWKEGTRDEKSLKSSISLKREKIVVVVVVVVVVDKADKVKMWGWKHHHHHHHHNRDHHHHHHNHQLFSLGKAKLFEGYASKIEWNGMECLSESWREGDSELHLQLAYHHHLLC